jgi:subtilisin-like proprotein convertase family protein
MLSTRRLFRSCQGALLAGALSLVPVAGHAAVPPSVPLEGALFSSGGGPAADGTYTVTFSLYKDAQTSTAAWTESASVAVKNGLFTYALGTSKTLDAAAVGALGGAPYLGVKVDPDPELPRKPVQSVLFALRASTAEALECSGCVGTTHLDPKVLADYAKTASLSKSATSGNYADLTGAPDLSVYAKLALLAKVASSGNYADLTGVPDLTAYAKVSSLAKIAGTGAYADLLGTPTLAKVATSGAYADLSGAPTTTVALGVQCGTGLVVKGINVDGSLNCIAAIDPAALPPDGINEISNNLIYNQFIDSVAGGTAVQIPDNNPVGVSDLITFPDIGLAQSLSVAIDVSNSDTTKLKISVIDPNSVEYVLFNGGASGIGVKTSYPDKTKPVSGDLTTWVGKNPAGKWYLKVVDTGFLNNAKDGQINSWSINIQTLSNKKVQVKGDLIVDGTIINSSVAPKRNFAHATVTGPHTANSAGSWANLDGNLKVTLNKVTDSAPLRIFLMLGAIEANSSWGWGAIEVRMDDKVIPSPWGCGSEYYSNSDGVRGDTVSCIAISVPKGNHTFTVWWSHLILEDIGHTASDGRQTAHATLWVEELQ